MVEKSLNICTENRLEFTEDLDLGSGIQMTGTDLFPKFTEKKELLRFSGLLKRMPNLKSLRIVGSPLLLMNKQVDENKNAEGSDGGPTNGMDPVLAKHLVQLKSLQEIIFIGYFYALLNANWHMRLPPFTRLRTLVLLKVQRTSLEPTDNAEDIAEVLLESPNLTSLGLSLDHGVNFDNMLRKLINYYRSRREALGKPRLKLSELYLGFGFLPAIPGEGASIPDLSDKFPEEDYLVNLTDLTALTSLRLDNWHVGDYDYMRTPWCEIQAHLFSHATQVRKISVERLSPDIIELIYVPKASNVRPGMLDELEVSRYFETLKPAMEPRDEVNGTRLYSQSMALTGNHWRKVSYGAKLQNDKQKHPSGEQILSSFVKYCAKLEELCLPMTRKHVKFFKASIMAWTPKLHTLMLIRGRIADQEIPQLSFIGYLRAKPEDTAKHADERNKKEEALERKRVELALELFSHNRMMMQRSNTVTALRYIGIGVHVYCCMVLVPEGSKISAAFSVKIKGTGLLRKPRTEEFQVVKLSPDQARSFDAVRRLDMEISTWW